MKSLLSSFLILGALTSLVACGGSSPKKLSAAKGSDPVDICPPHYVMGPTSCVPLQNTPTDSGSGPVSFIMEYNNPIGPEIGNMSLTDRTHYERFIKKAMQTCDRHTYNWGIYDCDTWIQGYQSVMISFDSSTDSQATVQVTSYPAYSGFNFQISIWPATIGMGFNPLILEMNAHPVNDNQGFELRSYGSNYNAGYRSLVQFKIPEGRLSSTTNFLDLEMYFEGELIARGRAERCQSMGCGFH